VLGTGEQKVKDAIQEQIARVKSIPDLVRGPGKKEKVEDYLLAKLPYHPQYVRSRTRFDAELLDPLSFGSEAAPVFSADHRLVLPEGTHLTGTVVAAKRARWFHRSGPRRLS
jgi:hypothetical protein